VSWLDDDSGLALPATARSVTPGEVPFNAAGTADGAPAMLRELILNTSRNYHPAGRLPGPTPTPRKRSNPEP
jgi:hypothetical protein